MSDIPVGLSDAEFAETYFSGKETQFTPFDGSQVKTISDFRQGIIGTEPSAGDLNIYTTVADGNGNLRLQVVEIFHGSTSSDSYPANAAASGDADITGIRGQALRMPMMAAGWGIDTEGRHVLDKTGNNDRAEIDANKLDSSQWKVGPIDLRWDEGRGVWTAAQAIRFKEFVNPE